MSRLFAIAPLVLAGALAAQVSPPSPDTRATPPPAPTLPKATPSLIELLRRQPGRWEGEQRVISPTKSVMLVRVAETYRMETGGGLPVLHGDIRYTVGSGDKTKTYAGSSRTWVDASGRGHAEVTQDGKTEKFSARADEDSLVFLPAGVKPEEASAGTGVRVAVENGVRVMIVRGFQKSPQGVYVIEGRLREITTPETPAAPLDTAPPAGHHSGTPTPCDTSAPSGGVPSR